MIRDGRRSLRSVGIESNERYVLPFSNQLKTQERQRSQHPVFGSVDRKPSQWKGSGQHGFSKKGLKHGRV